MLGQSTGSSFFNLSLWSQEAWNLFCKEVLTAEQLTRKMRISEVKFLAFVFFSCCAAYGTRPPVDNRQFAYLKAVKCQHNPKFLANVTCFAKSYSRTISTLTVFATIINPLTSVLVWIAVEFVFIPSDKTNPFNCSFYLKFIWTTIIDGLCNAV